MDKEFLTVSELNRLIQDVIHAGFPQPLWVCGEIQGYNRNRGKNHVFFELVEKDPDSGNIIAKIGLVLFAGRKSHVEDILKRSENAFSLKDDIEVKFACSVDFYPPHGALRLIVESIDPAYTLGRIAQEKQKLIALLKKRGVLDKNKQTELPLAPLRIGLITADDSAAYNDFCSELRRSGFGFRVVLCDALMQGKKAEEDICRALGELSKIKALDAVVITRGGGSIADLSCFDSRMIAEKVAGCPLPVLSGIGHEINITITDMAAHTYAKTPTAVAQFLVGRVQMFLDELDDKLERVIEGARGKIADERQRLKDGVIGLQNNMRAFLREHNERIIRLQEVIKHRPALLLKDRRKALGHTHEGLKRAAGACLANTRVRLANYRKIIDIAHPANTIRRGFSVTRTKDGRAVKNVAAVHPRDSLATEVADGVIESRVENIKKLQ